MYPIANSQKSIEEAIEWKIAEKVRHAELLAASAGENARAAGQQARMEGERLAAEKQFLALGIDPEYFKNPHTSEFTVLYTPMVSLSEVLSESHIQTSGSPSEIAQNIMARIIDEICASAKLKSPPVVE